MYKVRNEEMYDLGIDFIIFILLIIIGFITLIAS